MASAARLGKLANRVCPRHWQLSHVLSRIRMYKRRGSCALMIREYLIVLRTRYSHLLRLTAPSVTHQWLRHIAMSEPSVLRHLQKPEGDSSPRVTSARLPDTIVITDTDAETHVFSRHFFYVCALQTQLLRTGC